MISDARLEYNSLDIESKWFHIPYFYVNDSKIYFKMILVSYLDKRNTLSLQKQRKDKRWYIWMTNESLSSQFLSSNFSGEFLFRRRDDSA